jgi:hypothetical protein
MFQQSSDYISRSITTHGKMRRLHHQDARYSTIDHGDASDGVFLLLHLWVLPSSWSILFRRSPSSLSLACRLPLGANGSLVAELRHLQDFRVEDPSGSRKGGPNRPSEWARPAGLGRPAQVHPGPVRPPLRSRGSSGDYSFCPLHLHYFEMSSSHPRWRFSLHKVRSFTLESSGVFLRRTSVLTTIGSDFIKLMNTNKTP